MFQLQNLISQGHWLCGLFEESKDQAGCVVSVQRRKVGQRVVPFLIDPDKSLCLWRWGLHAGALDNRQPFHTFPAKLNQVV